MSSCCLLVTSVCPVFKRKQMLPWSLGALLIACRGQVSCFTCLGWGRREVRSIFLLAAEPWLKRVYWCSLWSRGSTCIVRGSRSHRPLLHGVEPTFLVGISPVWESDSDLKILQATRDASSACCLSLCGTSYLWLLAFLVFKVCWGCGDALGLWKAKCFSELFWNRHRVGYAVSWSTHHVWTQKCSMQIRSSGVCLVSLNRAVDQFLFVCYLQLIYHKA